MDRPNAAVRAAWVLHAIAWFLPVHKYGVHLPNGLPGWQAFRIALSPIVSYEGSGFEGPWYAALLMAASAFTNLIMLASVAIMPIRSERGRAMLAWAAVVATVLNAYWWMDKDRGDLRVGYYLWWTSFAVLAAGECTVLRMPQRSREQVPSGRTRG